MIAMTHINEPWLTKYSKQSVDLGGPNPDIRIIETGNIWQNLVENGGFLTNENIDRYIKKVQMTEPHNYGPRILGDSMMAGQVIFSSFRDEDPYVAPDFEVPRDWTWWEAFDPADIRDTIWIFFAVSPDDIEIDGQRANRVYLADYERYPSRDTVEDMAHYVKKRREELKYGEEAYSIVMDRKHGRREYKTETDKERKSWEEMFLNQEIGYLDLADQKPGDIEVGHKIIREYLKPQPCRREGKDIPGLVIMDRCRSRGKGPGPIEAFENYRKKRTSDDPEDDEYKDVMDAIRYGLMKIPTYVDKGRFKRLRERRTSKPVSELAGR